MAFNRVRAVVLGVLMAAAPLAGGPVSILSTANAATPAQIAAVRVELDSAARNAAQRPDFKAAADDIKTQTAILNSTTATKQEKDAAKAKIVAAQAIQAGILQLAVSGVFADPKAAGLSSAEVAQVLVAAVNAGVISANTAFAAAPAGVGQIVATQTNVTASTTTTGGPSLVTSTDGSTGSVNNGPTITPYDPCAGVTADYCG